jgi:hypothetical protein
MSAAIVAKERLYLDETRARVVRADDPDARYLLCVEGGEIPYEEAVKYGLLDGKLPDASQPEAEPDEDEEAEPVKAKAAPANKARAQAPDK